MAAYNRIKDDSCSWVYCNDCCPRVSAYTHTNVFGRLQFFALRFRSTAFNLRIVSVFTWLDPVISEITLAPLYNLSDSCYLLYNDYSQCISRVIILAMCIYMLRAVLKLSRKLAALASQVVLIQKRRKPSYRETHVFINTAHVL